ncbi:SRPBCC family protein [Mycolicibacterium sp. S3B2]|uniref:SRPBCC family protein n=1 Tax=Mycolicibacterium sp. S3B2 TaxID=3415120 RepID=UPI003C7DC38F
MAEVSCSRVIRARPEDVWAVLADFGAAAGWADGVDHCSLLRHTADSPEVGTARRVQVGRDTFVETITDFQANRVLAYDIAGLPPPVSANNRWTLRPDSTTTTAVTLTSSVRASRGPLRRLGEGVLARIMARRSRTLLASLASASEGVGV